MGADAFAIAQDGHTVGELEDFIEAMGDINDTNAAGAQIANDGEEEAGFVAGKRRGRFVHDDDAGAGTEGAGDFDELLFGHGERADFGVGQNIGADALEPLGGAAAALFPVHPGAGAGTFQAQADIFGDGQIGEQRRLLIDAGDAELVGEGGGQFFDAGAGDFNGPAIRLMRAADDFDERGFAGAVFAEQGVDLAGLQSNETPLAPLDGAEGFGDRRELQELLHF